MTSKNVPEDAVFEILSMLPVKSLLRFKCVCKEWLLLFDTPYFVSKHLECSRRKKTSYILAFEDKKDMKAFSLVSEETLDIVSQKIDVPLSDGTSFYGPVNGIVAVYDYDRFIFCNPSTREVKTFPPRSYNMTPGSKFRLPPCGFGFDEKSNDYKFIRIIRCRYKEGYPNEVQIYSLVRDCWRNLDHLTLPNARFEDSPSGYMNGRCHFFIHYNKPYPTKPRHARVILSFRMDTEVFEEIPLSDDVCNASNMRPYICLTGKVPYNLSVICYSPVKRIYDVWVMKEYGVRESWTKLYKVGPLSISGLFSPYPCSSGFTPDRIRSLYPMSIGNDDELLLCGYYGEFAFYNSNTQKFRVLKAYEEDRATITSAFYIESLVSIRRASSA